MTEAVSNMDICFIKDVMERTWILFTKFCVIWLNLPPFPKRIRVKIQYSKLIIFNSIIFSSTFESP